LLALFEATFPSSPPLHLPQSKVTYQSLNHPKTSAAKATERRKGKKKTKEKKKMPKQNKSPASTASLPRAKQKVRNKKRTPSLSYLIVSDCVRNFSGFRFPFQGLW
jgi:hypothetical protein